MAIPLRVLLRHCQEQHGFTGYLRHSVARFRATA
nr:MAG TPA: hypothetical protein [Caudoviricetes sp.]